MDLLLAALGGALGLFLGSFLTQIVAREPAGEPILKPRPHCRSCDVPLAATEQIPVLSWLLLRGRCRNCGAAIPVWYPLVEIATAVMFAGTVLWLGIDWRLPAYLFLAALTVVATTIDLQHHRLPNALTYPSVPIMVGLLALAVLGSGTWSDFGRALLGGGTLFLGYLLLALINPSGMGGGDVKLAPTLGLALGWSSWAAVIVGGLAGFFLGAIGGLLLIIFRRAGRKTKIPFGPFMFAGTYVGLLYGQAIADWYLQR